MVYKRVDKIMKISKTPIQERSEVASKELRLIV